MVGKELFGEDVGAEIVHDLCGCVFCDLGVYRGELVTASGEFYHCTTDDAETGEFIRCTKAEDGT